MCQKMCCLLSAFENIKIYRPAASFHNRNWALLFTKKMSSEIFWGSRCDKSEPHEACILGWSCQPARQPFHMIATSLLWQINRFSFQDSNSASSWSHKTPWRWQWGRRPSSSQVDGASITATTPITASLVDSFHLTQ